MDTISVSIQNEEFEEIKVLSCEATWRMEDSNSEYSLRPQKLRWVRMDPYGDGYDSFVLPKRVLPGYILQCGFELTGEDIGKAGIDVTKYPIEKDGTRVDFVILRATVEMESKSGISAVKTILYHHRIDKGSTGRIIDPLSSSEFREKEEDAQHQMRVVAEQQKTRSRFLEELFRRCGSSVTKHASFLDIGKQLGLDRKETENVLMYLRGEGLIDFAAMGQVCMTHRGIKEMEKMVTVQPSRTKLPSVLPKVFIVHGHDQEMRESVARALEKLGLDPIILHEQPNKGRTIMEKFTDYGDVGFAVVLLSPDDMGYAKNENPENAKARARQNVILELGFFIGKLGRDRVVAIYRLHPSFEMPSDYSGVLYTPYDDSGQWRFKLVTELQAAGYAVDANKLTKR